MRASAAVRPGLGRVSSAAGPVVAALVTAGAAAAAGAGAATAPDALRLLFAAGFAATLVALALARPRVAVVATMAFLIALAFLRRVLIADAGWSTYDPLLLVGPVVAVVLCVQLFVLHRRPLAPDRLSKVVLFVFALTLVQVLNPSGGGLAAGLGGFLFVGVPLLWFFIGRELASDVMTSRVLTLVLVSGVVAAAYGLVQIDVGFPSWDVNWLLASGYESLNVGSKVRAFAMFSSFVEYALFLGSALVVGFAFVLRGRAYAILALPRSRSRCSWPPPAAP